MSGEPERGPDVDDAEEPRVDVDERPDADRARDGEDRPFEWIDGDDVERPDYGPIVSAAEHSGDSEASESGETGDAADETAADGGEGAEGSDGDAGAESDGSEASVDGEGDAATTADEGAADETDDAEDETDGEDDGGESDLDDTGDGGADEGGADEDDADGNESSADGGDEDPPDDADTPRAETDGEGYVRDRPDDDPEYPDPDDDVGGISTPPDDEEMPLADHIEEMMLRLAAVFLIGGAATALGVLGASEAIDFIWTDVVPQAAERRPHIYHPLELWLTRIKVASLAGVLAALPMFVYQCYLFMRPGLYPNERKYYLSSVPMSLVLGVLGMYFSYRVVLPILFRYFTYYSEESANIQYALGDTFDLVITLTAFLAIVFQIPLFIMLAIMMGVTTRRWLAEKRLYFWAAFFGISFMFAGVDLTGMAPIIIGIVMVLLFEGTLFLLKWVGRE